MTDDELDEGEALLRRLERAERRSRITGRKKPTEVKKARVERAKRIKKKEATKKPPSDRRGTGFQDPETQAKAIETRRANKERRDLEEAEEIAAALLGILKRLNGSPSIPSAGEVNNGGTED